MATKQTVQLLMPEMGESVTEGTVLEWHVAEGDSVEEGQTMVEVSTDKVDAEVPAPAAGTVTKIMVQVDEEVDVGKPLAEIDPNGGPPEQAGAAAEDEGDSGEPAEPAAESNGAGAATAEAEPAESGGKATTDDASVSAGKELEGGGLEIVMPEMGESVTEGTVLEWHVSEGDQIAEGDTVVEVSTDKVDAEVPAPASGTVNKILVGPDETVEVGKPLAEMSKGAPPKEVEAPAGGGAETALGRGGDGSEGASSDDGEADSQRATPVARRAAQANGVDLKGLKGTGAGGKITKSDVLSAEGNGAAAPTAVEGETKPLRGPAATLARAMNESRSIPTATSFRELAVDTLDAKRKALNAVLEERGMKVSFTHLIAWAIVRAAQEWPVMARHYEEADGKPTVVEAGSINLGIAVDVERKGQRSLLVPVIKGADGLDFRGFHSYYEELITKTRENKLTADDFQGTNISLTNPGGLGTVASVPRLMAGQGTIVAAGSLAYPVEWRHAPPEKIKALGVSKVMTMTSTYDHRVIQGAESGSFLRRIEELLQGEDDFYESVAHDLGIEAGPITAAHPASASSPPLSSGAPAPAPGAPAKPNAELLQAVQAATSLLKAYRTHGHLAARLDPLGSEPKGDPALQPENVNLTPELMSQVPAEILRIGVEGETLLEALPRMREAYCGTIAYQIEHLSSHQQRMWLRDMIETGWHRKPLEAEEKHELLNQLIQVFGFERYLEKAYLGQKMFSIEGLDTVVPMLNEVFEMAHTEGAHDVVIGMAHRGRLSVLAHNIGRPIGAILAEFEGAKAIEAVKSLAAIPTGGTGDVKYHYGHSGLYKAKDGSEIGVRLYPNPSHLEYVDPVVTGAARASQTTRQDGRLEHDPMAAVPVLLHGDAAFPAQGVVAETLNLQSLKGYATGGTVHLIQNNQIGFTTDPEEGRSTPYAADMAKGFNVPIVHVNADDPEACLAAVRLAMAYRERWGRDVVIDLIGYRRFGHNETDEPAYTQPLMAQKIKEHPPVSQLYAEELVKEGVVTPDEVEERTEERQKSLKAAHDDLRQKIESGEYADPTQTGTGELDRTRSPSVDTAVPEDELRKLNEELLRVPDSFTIHRKLRKPLSKRLEAMDEGGIEFGHAESLALASLLTDGVHVRMTGQDTERGTFSHRHLVLHDEKTGLRYAPIQNLEEAQAPLELHNSPLSESACLGFEYGYSAHSPDSLVLWEAQFGDFGNAAQVIIDSFIVSAEAKWGQTSRLTLLLPHGYEGAGPEHSSARIERFIQLAAEGNIRLANPSTASQYFHLLRRQAHIAKARPMVVFTPKGLLRLPRATSTLEELTSGSFEFVLDDPQVKDKGKVERLALCSGKIYYDIDAAPKREEIDTVAIARAELLYPFAKEQLTELIASYPKLKEIVWVQEEPRNMGAWSVMQRRMPELLPEGVELGYIGRPPRASPGEGYAVAHTKEQERIVLTTLMGRADPA
ncbi:MAG TPA: multifunctional oxoglutarate decarboxylase/oxoglutarate dehydrogenase thiamine pyrophosphate-binding subunit/dihydrolipoyllysine-residue succinyltransferase subunit [Solirubrobacterales bacterium]|jgi:2-oxoglutarate dehydrogenase E1 component|nr:multifunctional oxoglutarate decarboxylase/oxoglutarate dehydrogenase thiamine pyrophosphate-binding subunit/dihydrolipoyllysine-residue succinyltransferase subunit [Solirubrobacterales bacterium]